MHEKAKVYKCSSCGSVYYRRDYFVEHESSGTMLEQEIIERQNFAHKNDEPVSFIGAYSTPQESDLNEEESSDFATTEVPISPPPPLCDLTTSVPMMIDVQYHDTDYIIIMVNFY